MLHRVRPAVSRKLLILESYASSMNKVFVWTAVGIMIAAVIIVLLTFTYGGLFIGSRLPIETTQPDEIAPDELDNGIEAYCESARENHIAHCGMLYPEQDYACRTTEAEQIYQECLVTTDPAEIGAVASGDETITDDYGDVVAE